MFPSFMFVEALADMFDDLMDARELRGEQLTRDARLAWSLFLSRCGQLCLDEGRRIRSLLTRFPLNTSAYFGGRFEYYERHICYTAHPDNFMIRCSKAPHSDGAHSNGDMMWNSAPQEQGSVISTVNDD